MANPRLTNDPAEIDPACGERTKLQRNDLGCISRRDRAVIPYGQRQINDLPRNA